MQLPTSLDLFRRSVDRDGSAWGCWCKEGFSGRYCTIVPRVARRSCSHLTPHTPVCVHVCTYALRVQEPRLIPQDELCRWLLKTDIRMAACFSLDMQNLGVFGQVPGASDSGSGSSASEPRGDGNVGLSSNSPPHVVYDDVPETGPDSPAARIILLRRMGNSLTEPPPPGPMSQKFASQIMPDVNLMMAATQR